MQRNKIQPAVAAILNLFAAPVGYLWIGAWRTAVVVLLLFFLGGAGFYYWSIFHPPGIYGAYPKHLLILRFAVGLIFALHAFAMGRRKACEWKVSWRIGAIVLLVLVFVVVAVLARAFAPLPVYSVASESMSPTLTKGDVLAISRPRALCGTAAPRIGDVVVFQRPGQPLRYMQRIVAGPGDTIAVQKAIPTVNGKAPSERIVAQIGPNAFQPYGVSLVRETLSNGASYTVKYSDEFPEEPYPAVKLGADQWYILGDNRGNAMDSRRIGPVRTSAICGVVYRFIQAHDPKRIGTKP
jgi:signal peptidase I